MQAEYKRDLQNNYLILEAGTASEEKGYPLKMAEENVIPGLLPLHSSRRNGILYINYEITSRQSLDSIFEKTAMNSQDIIHLLNGIKSIIEQMQSYLLNPMQLLFDPQFIYMDTEYSNPLLCYYPGEVEEGQIVLLAEFILKHLNHEERRCVVLGYNFYQKAVEKNFSLRETLKEVLESVQDQKQEKEIAYRSAAIKDDPEEHEMIADRLEELENDFGKDYEKEFSETYETSEANSTFGNIEEKKIKIFDYVHPAILISFLGVILAVGGAYTYFLIDLIEAGGIILGTLAAALLLNEIWRKKKKTAPAKQNPTYEDETEMYELLKEEMYDHIEDSKVQATQYLYESDEKGTLRLIMAGSRAEELPDIVLDKECVTIGKMKGMVDVILNFPTVSRKHAQITREGELYYIKDMNSRNGTFYNQERILPNQKCELKKGDRVSFAEIEYMVV